jgi:uncharacterized protein YqiB (DUF1249 family)
MLSDSYIVPECLASPRSFGGLMALYESNFIKLSTLAGVSDLPEDMYLSHGRRDCRLHLCFESRSKYTRVIRLTYLFDQGGGPVAEPDLKVKLYLDARLTEVLSWADQHRHVFLTGLAQQFSCELDRRWSCNMMLSKWLDYLLDMDHIFRPVCASHEPAILA